MLYSDATQFVRVGKDSVHLRTRDRIWRSLFEAPGERDNLPPSEESVRVVVTLGWFVRREDELTERDILEAVFEFILCAQDVAAG